MNHHTIHSGQVRSTKYEVRSTNAPRAFPLRPSYFVPRTSRRGSILIAIVVTLIILQIAVIGIVSLGGRDQNLIKLRLESEQAQYAAESGIGMALREVYNSVDEDTDGGIGTISAKTINGCSVSVTSSTSGATTTLTATATATTAKRVVVVKYSS